MTGPARRPDLTTDDVLDPPDIAVVVPTYRRGERAVRMVEALERQTLPPDRFEVIVVDDHSGDGSLERIRDRLAASRLRARALDTGANGGPAVARNMGARAATAALLAFVDDDCTPEPGWLEAGLAALRSDERAGVIQGRTERPPGAALGDWTLFREIHGATPFFEGCNIFYRRDALLGAGGFDEVIRWYGEDTAAGWAVLEAGWDRGFAPDAVVVHDVEERGVWWHVQAGLYERNLVGVAARYPGFRAEAFWRPWAFRRENVAATAALAGLVLATRWRPALLLVVPWLRWRRPPEGHHRYAALLAERAAVDAAQAVGLAVGSATHRTLVL